MFLVGGSGGGALAGVSAPTPRCGVQKRPEKESALPRSKKGEERMVVRGRGFGEKVDTKWLCARGCGACCKLEKGPAFPTPEEIFTDNPSHLQLYKSLIGRDGWCIHYEHATRSCSIYPERPFFCRVEPDVFEKLYGVSGRRFNKEACRSCRDTITAIYGPCSEELNNFNRAIRNNT